MGAGRARASAGKRPIFGSQGTVLRLSLSRLLCATAVLGIAAFSSRPAVSQQATPSAKQITPAPSTKQPTAAKSTEAPYTAHPKHHKKPETATVAVPPQPAPSTNQITPAPSSQQT